VPITLVCHLLLAYQPPLVQLSVQGENTLGVFLKNVTIRDEFGHASFRPVPDKQHLGWHFLPA
jgi:hypothetical protein